MIKLTDVQKAVEQEFQLGPVDFQIEPGTVTALIGNNGAGKSTLARLITGMVFKDKGTIERFKTEGDKDWKEWIGYVPQTSLGYDRFTLSQLAELHSIGYKEWRDDIYQRLIKRFALPENKRIDALSGGMQKQALVVLALARNTKLLVMDEPLAGVDIESQIIMREEWVAYLEAGPERSILFATHIPEEVKESADYVACMYGGRITGTYEKDDLQQHYGRIWVNSTDEKLWDLSGVTGVKSSGRTSELITKAAAETEQALKTENIEVVMQQSLSFTDILHELLKESRRHYSETS